MGAFQITLASARVNAGYTVKQASEIIGIHHQKIVDYERGRIPIPENMLVRFSNSYKIPIKHLLQIQPRKDFE